MALHCLYTALGQVIPDLDHLVVFGGDEIRPVGTRMKDDVIDTLVVCIHGEVGMWRADGPHLMVQLRQVDANVFVSFGLKAIFMMCVCPSYT